MIDSQICIDTGNSGTKIVHSNPGTDEVKSLFMSSSLDEVEPEQLENEIMNSGWIGTPDPIQQAWVKVDNSLVVVGELAQKFSPPDKRQIPKYESALCKILAAIGVIRETEFSQNRKKINIELGLLLPWNEYIDRKRLLKELTKKCEEFEFRGHKIRVSIKRFVCYPEGGGVAMSRLRENGKDWFKQQKLGILMFGDRNWTGLYIDSGQTKEGDSPLEGFSFTLDNIIKNSPCLLNRENLSRAIFQAINERNQDQETFVEPSWSDLKPIQSLATAKKTSFKFSEIEDIDKAITQAGKTWSTKLKHFIEKMFPQELTEINVCGGALPFYLPTLEKYFNCVPKDLAHECMPKDANKPYTKVLVNGGTSKTVAKALGFNSPELKKSAFPVRFADVFSLILYLKI